MFAIEGTDSSAANGPHIQITTNSDNYPLLQLLAYSHDNIILGLDMYYDGTLRSADAGSNCYIRKINDRMDISYDSGVGQGSAVAMIAAMSIDLTSGQVGFGILGSATSAKMHIDQFGASAAIPVLYLDQGDVDQPMIEFNTTLGTGNAIEAIGGKSLTTTHFVMVKLPGGLIRYFPVGTIA